MEKTDSAQSKYFDFAIELVFLIFIFLVPVVFDRRIGIVFSGTKLPVIRILSLMILSIWASKILIFKEHRFVRSILDWPVASYMLAVTVATLTSVQVLISIAGFYGRFEGLSTWYIYGLLYFVVTNFIKTKEQFRRIFMAVLSAATLMSVYGIIQRMGIDPYAWGGVVTWQRVIATIGQPNFLAAYVLMAFFMGLAVLIMDHEEAEVVESAPLVKKKYEKQKTAKKPSLQDRLMTQGMIVLSFAAVTVSYLVMIFMVDTNIFPLLVLSWAVVTSFVILFVFISKDIDPIVMDGIILVSLPLIYTCIFFTQSRGGLLAFLGAGSLFIILADRNSLLKHWKELGVLAAILFIITAVTITNPNYSPFARFAGEIKVGEEGANGNVQQQGGPELTGAAGSRIETWNSAFRIIADRPISGIGPEVLKMVFPRYETELFRFKEAFHVKQDRCHNEVFDIGVTKGIFALLLYVWLIFTFYKLGLKKLSESSDVNYKLYIAGLLAAFAAYCIQNLFSFGVIAITSLVWIMFGMVAAPQLNDDKDLKLPKFVPLSVSHVPWLPTAGIVFCALILSYYSTIQFRADLYFKSGKTYVDRGMFDLALADFRRSLEIFPYEGGAMTYYGITYLNVAQNAQDNKQRLFDEAMSALLRATKADPYNADNFYIMGKTYLSLQGFGVAGALEKSLEQTNKAIAIDPYYAEAYHNRGLVYEIRGQLPEAAAEYKKAFMINPSLTMSMQRLGLVYSNMGKPDMIITTFNEALEKYKDNVGLLENLAFAYSTMKREDKAIEVFEQILKQNPKYMPALINIAAAYIRRGEFAKAESYLIQAVMNEPNNIDAYNNLGLVYLRQGKTSQAIESFKQALILKPDNEYAKNMLKQLGVK
jgi:tetratricopeptide (TPR) repeat protein